MKKPATKPPAAKIRRTLVIAENHAEMANALVTLLHDDFDVLAVAESGERLLEYVKTLRPDGVVSDVNLEGLDGIAATSRIRALFPTLPVVLLTAGDIASLQPAGIAAGAATLLAKAQADKMLVRILNELFERSHLSESR